MNTEKIITLVLLGINVPILIGFGLLFLHGKGAGLVIHSQREWHTLNVSKLLRFMAYLMFALAAAWIPAMLGTLLDCMPLFWAGFGLFCAVAIAGAIFANTKRFKK